MSAESKNRRYISQDELEGLCTQFQERLPNEVACLNELYRCFQDANEIYCKRCNSSNVTRAAGKRTLHCMKCHKKTSFTTGTIFQGASKLSAYMFAIELREMGVVVAAHRYSELLNVAQATASLIFMKLGMCAHSILEELKTIDVKSEEFISLVGRRSTETPAQMPPSAEEDDLQQRSNLIVETTEQADAFESEKMASLSPAQQRIYEFICTNKECHIEEIFKSCGYPIGQTTGDLVVLDLAGLVTSLPGNRYEQKSKEATKNSRQCSPKILSSELESFSAFIKQNFHSISRKNLQLYLATFFQVGGFDKRMTDNFFSKCISFRPISILDILNYVTPLRVMSLPFP